MGRNESSSFGVAKALAQALSAHTTRTADIVLMEKDARSNLALALSDLPPWLDAVAQISGRVPFKRARVRVTKNYPLGDGEGAEELRVAATTDAAKLAGSMQYKLTEDDGSLSPNMIKLSARGNDAVSKAILALETLHFQSQQEVTFKVTKVMQQMDRDGEARVSTIFLVAFT